MSQSRIKYFYPWFLSKQNCLRLHTSVWKGFSKLTMPHYIFTGKYIRRHKCMYRKYKPKLFTFPSLCLYLLNLTDGVSLMLTNCTQHLIVENTLAYMRCVGSLFILVCVLNVYAYLWIHTQPVGLHAFTECFRLPLTLSLSNNFR